MERKKTSGKVTFQDKSIYIGELENEIPNGYGVWSHPNGEEYKGQWADGKENGSGIYSYPDGVPIQSSLSVSCNIDVS